LKSSVELEGSWFRIISGGTGYYRGTEVLSFRFRLDVADELFPLFFVRWAVSPQSVLNVLAISFY